MFGELPRHCLCVRIDVINSAIRSFDCSPSFRKLIRSCHTRIRTKPTVHLKTECYDATQPQSSSFLSNNCIHFRHTKHCFLTFSSRFSRAARSCS